jgi:hypothetical protein
MELELGLIADVIAALAAAGATLTAIAVAIISGFQLRVTRLASRLNLYDKRYAVFLACRELLVFVQVENVEDRHKLSSAIYKFRLDTIEAPFLFGPEIELYTNKLAEEVLALRKSWSALHKSTNHEQHDQKSAEIGTKEEWLDQELKELRSRFADYLLVKDL